MSNSRNSLQQSGSAAPGFTGLFLAPADQGGEQGRVLSEIVALGLERNAWELDCNGYTVVSPQDLRAGALTDRVREKLLDLAEADLGFRPDLEAGEDVSADRTAIGRGHFIQNPLYTDQAFEEALMNRSVLALMTYLLGESCVLSSMSAMLKVRAPEGLELHSDQVGQPAPFPPYAQVANASWALTDYSAEHGATRFVPGSHKLCRHPTKEEALDTSLAQTVSAPAGSVVIWHGNTWHGAAPRTTAGGRLTLIMLFCRWYLMPQRLFRQSVPPELLARNSDRFSMLMGKRAPYSGADSDGAKVDFTLGQSNQFA